MVRAWQTHEHALQSRGASPPCVRGPRRRPRRASNALLPAALRRLLHGRTRASSPSAASLHSLAPPDARVTACSCTARARASAPAARSWSVGSRWTQPHPAQRRNTSTKEYRPMPRSHCLGRAKRASPTDAHRTPVRVRGPARPPALACLRASPRARAHSCPLLPPSAKPRLCTCRTRAKRTTVDATAASLHPALASLHPAKVNHALQPACGWNTRKPKPLQSWPVVVCSVLTASAHENTLQQT